ncbi:hypothetical protein [Bradyrhizobium hipponense]|nr:hypothetical protein [Bradyrhizobium hipponense]
MADVVKSNWWKLDVGRLEDEGAVSAMMEYFGRLIQAGPRG